MGRQNDRPSFTLIEVLIAVSIILIVTASSVMMLKNALRYQTTAIERSAAIFSVQSKLEEIRSMAFSDLPPLSGKTFDSGRGKIAVSPQTPDILLIEVSHDIAIQTLRSRY